MYLPNALLHTAGWAKPTRRSVCIEIRGERVVPRRALWAGSIDAGALHSLAVARRCLARCCYGKAPAALSLITSALLANVRSTADDGDDCAGASVTQ